MYKRQIFKYVILGIVAVAMFVCTYLYDPHKEEKLAAEERKRGTIKFDSKEAICMILES